MRECPLICDSSLACLSAVATLEQLSLDMCGRITDRGARQPCVATRKAPGSLALCQALSS